jgi:hypothetical protein
MDENRYRKCYQPTKLRRGLDLDDVIASYFGGFDNRYQALSGYRQSISIVVAENRDNGPFFSNNC